MKFFGHGIVYVPVGEKNVRVKFDKVQLSDPYEKGVYETEDKKIADGLIKLGYESQGKIAEPKAEPKPKKEK